MRARDIRADAVEWRATDVRENAAVDVVGAAAVDGAAASAPSGAIALAPAPRVWPWPLDGANGAAAAAKAAS